MNHYELVRQLARQRALKHLSQQDVADKMGCTQSRVSKMEGGRDVDLTLGNLSRYAEAVGLKLKVSLGE